MPDITLQEYIQSSQQGLLSRIFGPEFMMKNTYLQQTNIFTETFGRRVWDALNNRTVFYNAVRKVGWGPTFGWRLRTDRGTGNSRPITEVGSLPTLDVSNFVNVGSPPKIPATTFGVSIKAQFMGGLEGGIGDALAVEQEAKMRDHIKEINQELLKGNYLYISAQSTAGGTIAAGTGVDGVGATWVARYTILPAAKADQFNIGDTVGAYDVGVGQIESDSGGGVCTVIGRDITNGYVYTDAALNFTAAAGDTLYSLDRVAGITPISDVCMYDGVVVAGSGAAYVDVFNLGTRTQNGYAAGCNISANAGVGRDITLKLLDDEIARIRGKGGLLGASLILTGHNQYGNFERLLQAHQRYVGYQTFQFGVGDEKTYPGTQVGMELATYRGMPILCDADVPTGVSSAGAALGEDIFVMDLDHLELAVAMPTQYFQNQNYFVANKLVVQGLMFTMMELRAQRLDLHSRITDLNT